MDSSSLQELYFQSVSLFRTTHTWNPGSKAISYTCSSSTTQFASSYLQSHTF